MIIMRDSNYILSERNNYDRTEYKRNSVEEKLGRAGMPLKQSEGYGSANWILLDFGDIIVHIFDNENRLFYDLERIWSDGRKIDLTEWRS